MYDHCYHSVRLYLALELDCYRSVRPYLDLERTATVIGPYVHVWAWNYGMRRLGFRKSQFFSSVLVT